MSNQVVAPDYAVAWSEGRRVTLKYINESWSADGIRVRLDRHGDDYDVLISADAGVSYVALRWQWPLSGDARILGDHWERGYGDLEWRGADPERVLPWYALIRHGETVTGWGVRTGGGSLASWRVDGEGVTLFLDVRCGGSDVLLGNRELPVASVVKADYAGLSAFAAAQAFCRLMCPSPRLPARPIYGGNNWYYAYGRSSRSEILADSKLIADLAPVGTNRPFMVIDDGWEPNSLAGPWTEGNVRFPDMGGLASEMSALGVDPGIWIRPLCAKDAPDASLLLQAPHSHTDHGDVLDPTIPSILEMVTEDIRRLANWGYRLIKHDFSTFDLLGRWGFTMGADITASSWRFYDQSQTTAEVIRTLYQVIRSAAGDAVIIGCNTIGHLGAGLFELQRTGDDTSGIAWSRTRKMGINTLAFRMPQHDTLFAADADCVGLTTQVPWALNAQWLDLLAKSGTPLFVSAAPAAVGPEQRKALESAFVRASERHAPAEPLDWMNTTCPRKWLIDGDVVEYDWLSDNDQIVLRVE